MDTWYYSPWQYELREQVTGEDTSLIRALSLGSRVGLPPVVSGVVLGATVALAYTPLLQPGPAAKTPTPNTLQLYRLGGGLIV